MYIQINTLINTYIHMCVYIYIYIYTYLYTHIHIYNLYEYSPKLATGVDNHGYNNN